MGWRRSCWQVKQNRATVSPTKCQKSGKDSSTHPPFRTAELQTGELVLNVLVSSSDLVLH